MYRGEGASGYLVAVLSSGQGLAAKVYSIDDLVTTPNPCPLQ